MIKGVELRNIKSYVSAEVKFTPGTNSIIGENGAGKTTILESVGFVLFDHLPYTLSAFLRSGETTGIARVTIISKMDGREYQVVRKLTKSSTSEYMVVDPELKRKVCEGKADVLDWVRKNLGIGRYIDLRTFFENAVGVRQGTMVSPFLLPPHARKNVFSPLLGLDVYRTAFEKSREYLNFLEKRISEMKSRESELSGRLSTLEDRVKMLDALKEELNHDITKLRALEKKLEETELKKKRLEKTMERIAEIETELRVLNTRITEIGDSIERARGELKVIEGKKEEMEKHKIAYRDYLRYQELLAGLEKELEKLSHERDTLIKDRLRLKELETKLESLKERLEEINNAEKEIATLEKLLESVKTAEIEERSLIEFEKEYAVLEDRKTAIRSEIDRIKEKIWQMKELSRIAEEYRKKIENLDELESKTEKLKKIINHLDSRIKLFSDNLKSLRKSECPFIQERCDRVSEKIGNLSDQMKEMMEKRDQALKLLGKNERQIEKLKDLRSEYERIEGQIEQLPDLEKDLEKLNSELEKITERQEILKDELRKREVIEIRIKKYREIQQKLAVCRNNVEEKPGIVSEKEGVESEVGELRKRISRMDLIEKEIRDREKMRQNLQKELEMLRGGYETYLSLKEIVKRKPLLEDQIEKDRKLLKRLEIQKKERTEEHENLISSFNVEELRKIEEMFRNLTSEAGVLKGKIAEKKRQIEELEKDAREIEKLKKEFERIGNSIEKETMKYDLLKEVREIFNEAIPSITGAYVRVISQEANRLFNEIMGDYSWTLEWKEDFGISLKYRGRELDFGQLSGGEQMVAAISLRLALLRHLSGIDFAFFDEPTQNMDEIRRMNLANQIGRIAGFSQLFVISHDDTFEEVTDNSIRIVKDNDHSRVVQ